jgi:regulatory protein
VDGEEFAWPEGSVPASTTEGRRGRDGRNGAGRNGAERDETPVDPAERAREICLRQLAVRPRTRSELAGALRQRGIDDEVAAEALATVAEADEVDAARMLVRRKLRSVRGLDEQKAVRRLVGMLARKGHSSAVAYRVVREELGADLADPEHL